MILDLTDENFEKEISNSSKPVLVDFWMSGCGPCALLSPILEKLADDFKERIIFAKANLDSAVISAQKYEISVAPTVILFKEGKAVEGFVGARPEEWIRGWLDNLTKNDGKQ